MNRRNFFGILAAAIAIPAVVFASRKRKLKRFMVGDAPRFAHFGSSTGSWTGGLVAVPENLPHIQRGDIVTIEGFYEA